MNASDHLKPDNLFPYPPEPDSRPSIVERIRRSPTPATWTLLAINAGIWLILEATGGSQDVDNLLRFGAKFGPSIAEGEWWRLFTPMFLHIGFLHLLTNSFGLLIFGRLVERYFGSVNFLVIYLLAGTFGNIASYAAVSGGVGAGASGAVFGVVAAYGAFLFRNRTVAGAVARSSLGGLALIVGANLLFGFAVAGIDNWAHIGGLVSGFLISLRLVPTVTYVPFDFALGESRYLHVPRLVPPSRTARVEVVLVSAITIVLTTWVIGTAYPIV